MSRPKILLEKMDRLRGDLDVVDDAIQDLLVDRQQLVGRVGLIKAELDMEPHQPGRFAAMKERLHARADVIGLRHDTVDGVWDAVHESSINAQAEQQAEPTLAH